VSYTFRLTLKDGDDAGDFVTAVPGPWNLPVPEGSVYDGLWMVEQVEPV
jgi:hypothetical protein